MSSVLGPQECAIDLAGLASGAAGLAIFHAYLSEAQPDLDERASKHALEFMSTSVEMLATRRQMPRFYSGFTGVAWVLEHLQGRLLEPEDDDPNSGIDDALEVLLDTEKWGGDYDLISGLVGYGIYAMEREGSPLRRKLLTTILRHLEQSATVTSQGVTWFTPPWLLTERQLQHSPGGFYNLGLAHGVPGVVVFLALMCANDIESEKARPLLDGAVNWLLAQENPAGSEGAFTSALAADGSSDRASSRIAWCYGDLGIATALLWAARSVGESDWEREAIRIATMAARRSFQSACVIEACLCHGAAGNGHLFNRLYQATRDEVFLEAARRYFALVLRYRKPGQGVAGFLSWNGYDAWTSDPGFLEGAAGIGLALLAAVSSVEPDWDRVLMVSVPPR